MDDKKQIEYFRGKPYEKADHLAYLRIEPALFETEEEKALKKRRLCCAACGHPVTQVAEKVDILGRHEWAFGLYNEIVQLGCFRKADGCVGVRQVAHGYSWFRGYAWQIQVCGKCYTQLGWKYTSPEDSFYGLIFDALRDEDPKNRG
jgi:hypothetical protein